MSRLTRIGKALIQHRHLDRLNERHAHRHADALRYASSQFDADDLRTLRSILVDGNSARHAAWNNQGDTSIGTSLVSSTDKDTRAFEVTSSPFSVPAVSELPPSRPRTDHHFIIVPDTKYVVVEVSTQPAFSFKGDFDNVQVTHDASSIDALFPGFGFSQGQRTSNIVYPTSSLRCTTECAPRKVPGGG